MSTPQEIVIVILLGVFEGVLYRFVEDRTIKTIHDEDAMLPN